MRSLSPLEEEKENHNINPNEVEPIENGLFGFWGEGVFLEIQTVCGATCFATLPQNELNSDVACFTSNVQTCLATTQVKQVAKMCCRKCLQRVVLLFGTKSVHDARFTCPRQTCCAASDVTPVYGVTPA